MARTKQTARKSSGGKAPRKLMACKSPAQFRQYMTSQQAATYQTSSSTTASKTSYLNYENVFGSFGFPMGEQIKETFKPQFEAGYSVNPIDKSNEPWLCMKLKSKFDGAGMDKHQRPDLNVVLVIDISGSMASLMSTDLNTTVGGESKLDAAKKCMLAICEKFTNTDFVGLVAFDDRALRIIELSKWENVAKTDLQDKIGALRPTGMTNLSLAYTEATKMLKNAGEKQSNFSRIIFMTDLNSTVDNVRDEKDLLAKIGNNSKNNIFTTVVGIGMDFNVTLVQKISSTPGANYISASSGTEFVEVVGKEFNYNVTITAYQIKVDLSKIQNSFEFIKGYGSPEISSLKKKDQVCLSSEFASAQNEKGEITGGVLLFKLKQLKKDGKDLKIKLSFQDIYTSANVTLNYTIELKDSITDIALRKAILLTHLVDLHNDYVLEKKGVKHLERFQSFKRHLVDEMKDMNDDSIDSNNIVYMEMTDKIIDLELESQKIPKSTTTPAPAIDLFMPSIFSNSPPTLVSSYKPTRKKSLKRLVASKGIQTNKAARIKIVKKEPTSNKPVAMPKVKSEPVDTKPKLIGVRASTRKRSATNSTVVNPAKKVKVASKAKKEKSPKKKLTKPTAAKPTVKKVKVANKKVSSTRVPIKKTRSTKKK